MFGAALSAQTHGSHGCFNPVLTTLLRCNTAPVLLGSRESSRGACFYLVKYLTKDSVALTNSLSLLADAKQHIEKYGSTAKDAGTKLRTARHFLQHAVNTYQAEVHITQAASLLLDCKASYCSERFVSLATWSLTREGLKAQGLDTQPWMEGVADGADAHKDENVDEAGLHGESDEEDADTEQIGRDTQWAREQKEEAYDGMGPPSNLKPFTDQNGLIHAMDTAMHYRLRGYDLTRLNAFEYAMCINVVKMTDEESEAALADAKSGQLSKKRYELESLEDEEAETKGEEAKLEKEEDDKRAPQLQRRRRPNSSFRFHPCHPLYFSHKQKLASKQGCVMHVGSPIPLEPKQLGATSTVSNVWLQRRRKFATYTVALFVPWEHGETTEDCKPPQLTPATLLAWRQHLQSLAERELVEPTDESTANDMPMSSHDEAPQREQQTMSPFEAQRERTIARGRVFALREWSHALSVSTELKQALMQWRNRNRQTWPKQEDDGEENQMKRRKGANADALDQVDSLRWENQAMNVDPKRCEQHSKNELYLEEQLNAFGLQAMPMDHARNGTAVSASTLAEGEAEAEERADEGTKAPHGPQAHLGTITTSKEEAAKKAKALSEKIDNLASEPPEDTISSESAARLAAGNESIAAAHSVEFAQLGDGSEESAEQELQSLVEKWKKQRQAAKREG